MRARGVAPDEITYSSAITACGNSGQAGAALNLLRVRAPPRPANRSHVVMYMCISDVLLLLWCCAALNCVAMLCLSGVPVVVGVGVAVLCRVEVRS